MKAKDIFSKYGAYVLAAVLFIAAAIIYCSPQLKGKVIYAGDVQGYLGASQEARQFHNDTGEYSFWTGSMFCGMPNYQIGGGHYASDSLLAPLTRIVRHNSNPIKMLILYFVCFFIMLRAFGIDKKMSIAGAFAVALSSYFLVIIPAGHYSKVFTIALCGVVVGGFNLIFNKKYALGAIMVMLSTSLAFKPHPQMFYYFCLMMGVLWICYAYDAIKEKQLKHLGLSTAIFALSLIIGIGTVSANIFANSEYVSETMRGRQSDLVPGTEEKVPQKGLDIAYATQWSYGIDETMTFLIPGFKGGANAVDVGKKSILYKELIDKGIPSKSAADFCKAAPMYWGDQPFTAGNVYMGAIVCFLFVLGLCVVKGSIKWGLLVCTLFAIMLAWGSNFMWLTEFFFKHFPMYNKFRAVSSILVVAEVAMPLLGFLALKEIIEGAVKKEKLIKSIYVSSGITGGICLFFALFGGAMFSFTCEGDAAIIQQIPDWLYASICDQRAALLRSDSLRSALFIAAAALTVWIYAKGKLKTGALAAILGVLIVLDMWPVDKRYFNESNYVSKKNAGEAAFVMTDYEKAILKDPDYFRVYNLTSNTFNESRTSYYLNSIGGYSAVKLRRYNDLINEHLSKASLPVLSMLNAKYFIVPGSNGSPVVQTNPCAQGNAWFVDKLTVVNNANEESAALGKIDLTHEAVLDKSFEQFATNTHPAIPDGASVRLTSHTPKEMYYSYSTSKPGTIVFSEIYYPYGWKASIDGEPVEHYRVNYVLRALNVPAGDHSIHFIFDPDSVHKGNVLSVIAIVIMYLFTLAVIAQSIYGAVKRRKEQK